MTVSCPHSGCNRPIIVTIGRGPFARAQPCGHIVPLHAGGENHAAVGEVGG